MSGCFFETRCIMAEYIPTVWGRCSLVQNVLNFYLYYIIFSRWNHPIRTLHNLRHYVFFFCILFFLRLSLYVHAPVINFAVSISPFFSCLRSGQNVGSRRRRKSWEQNTNVNLSWMRRSCPTRFGRDWNRTDVWSSAPWPSASLLHRIRRPSRPPRPTRRRPRPPAATPTTVTKMPRPPPTPMPRHFRRKPLRHSARIFWSRVWMTFRPTTVVVGAVPRLTSRVSVSNY